MCRVVDQKKKKSLFGRTMMLLDEAENPKDPKKGVISRNIKLYSTPTFVPLIRTTGLSNAVQLPVCLKFIILSNQLDFIHMDPALKDRIRVCFNRYSTSTTDLAGNPIPEEFQVPRDPQLKHRVLEFKGIQHFAKLMMNGLSDVYMDPLKADPESICKDTKTFLKRYEKKVTKKTVLQEFSGEELLSMYTNQILGKSKANRGKSNRKPVTAKTCLKNFVEYAVSTAVKRSLKQTESITKQDIGRSLKRSAKLAGMHDKQWKVHRKNNQQFYNVVLKPTSEIIKKITAKADKKKQGCKADKNENIFELAVSKL